MPPRLARLCSNKADPTRGGETESVHGLFAKPCSIREERDIPK